MQDYKRLGVSNGYFEKVLVAQYNDMHSQNSKRAEQCDWMYIKPVNVRYLDGNSTVP